MTDYSYQILSNKSGAQKFAEERAVYCAQQWPAKLLMSQVIFALELI